MAASGTRFAAACLLVVGAAGGCGSPGDAPGTAGGDPPATTRGVWVVRTDLGTPEGVDRVVREALEAGCNTLFAQVRGRGDAWYTSALEPPPPALQGSGFDPLARLLEAARAAGLRVHAWVNANLVWDVEEPNPHHLHLVHRHPEWLCLPRELAPDLLTVPPGAPRFLEALESYVRRSGGGVEGLYADPAHKGWREHLAAVCARLAERYSMDGLHLDYIRYPGQGWGYSRTALRLMRAEVHHELSAAERRAMDARALDDPLVYTRRYPVRWARFRRRAVDDLVGAVSRAVRRVAPACTLSAAVLPDPQVARERCFQDWVSWLQRGLLDVACPMNYTTDRERFEGVALAAADAAAPHPLWMGIGAWRLEPSETAARIRWLGGQRAAGVVLFSLGGLRGRSGALDVIRRLGFAAAADSGA